MFAHTIKDFFYLSIPFYLWLDSNLPLRKVTQNLLFQVRLWLTLLENLLSKHNGSWSSWFLLPCSHSNTSTGPANEADSSSRFERHRRLFWRQDKWLSVSNMFWTDWRSVYHKMWTHILSPMHFQVPWGQWQVSQV